MWKLKRLTVTGEGSNDQGILFTWVNFSVNKWNKDLKVKYTMSDKLFIAIGKNSPNNFSKMYG